MQGKESKRNDRLAKVMARNICNSIYGSSNKSREELEKEHAYRLSKQPEIEKQIRARLEA